MEREQLSWQERGQLWLRLIIRLVLAAAAVVLVAKLGPPLLSLFAPFVAALIVAALLNPAVRWLQRRLGWSRKLLSLLLVVVIFGVIGGCLGILTYAAANELVSLAQNWSGMLTQVEGFFDQMEALFARAMDLLPLSVVGTVEDTVNALIQRLQAVDPTALLSAAKAATDWAMRVPEFLLALVVFVMASYFLTADYPYHRTRAVQHLDESLLRFLQQVKATALAAFGGYLRAELLLSVGVFFILLGGFVLTRQPYGLLLALGLAVLDFIPIVGAGTVMVPWAVVELITRNFSSAISLMVIWGIIALFRRAMEPKFVGDQTGLSPVLSLLSVYVGMKLGGVLGMILGPVLTLVLLNLAGMGMFRGLRSDLAAAAWDVAAILSRRPEDL